MVEGERKLLELFKACEEAPEEQRWQLEEQLVSRLVVLVGASNPVNGNFGELVEAYRRYPRIYHRVIAELCRCLDLPAGLTSVLRLYIQTQDSTLEKNLRAIRQEAVASGSADILEAYQSEGLVKEFGQAAIRRQRS